MVITNRKKIRTLKFIKPTDMPMSHNYIVSKVYNC